MILKVALLQINSGKTQDENLAIGKAACKKAKELGADIALFPELWNCGYDLSGSQSDVDSRAIKSDSEFVLSFQNLARELQMSIAITFLEKSLKSASKMPPLILTSVSDETDLSKSPLTRAELQSSNVETFCGCNFKESKNQPLYSVVIFDMNGKEILHYSKVHTCDFGDEKLLAQGDDFYVAPLETKNGSLKSASEISPLILTSVSGETDLLKCPLSRTKSTLQKVETSCNVDFYGSVKIGSMICYDREFPESARILMLKGAEVVLVPNACPMEINRLSQLRGRAYENMFAIATCNYPAPHPDCNGHSSVFDGVAYLPQLSGSRDTCVFEADEKEGVFIAELDLQMIRDYRNREVHGNAYRHPEKYSLLVETEKQEPFIRSDFRE